MAEGDGGESPQFRGREMLEYEGRDLTQGKAMKGFEKQDQGYGLDLVVHWKPLRRCDDSLSNERGVNYFGRQQSSGERGEGAHVWQYKAKREKVAVIKVEGD